MIIRYFLLFLRNYTYIDTTLMLYCVINNYIVIYTLYIKHVVINYIKHNPFIGYGLLK